MYLIEKLQEKILAKNTPTSEVLETAITIGNNENIQELIDWATLELNGYQDTTIAIPNYRILDIKQIMQFNNMLPIYKMFALPSEPESHQMKYNIVESVITLEHRLKQQDLCLECYDKFKNQDPSFNSRSLGFKPIEIKEEDLEKILYQIQQETKTKIIEVKKEMKEKQSVTINNNIDNSGDYASVLGGGYQSTHTVNNYVTNEQKIDLQNQLNQLQELIKEYQENADYEYVKGEISHIQKQLEHPPIEHKKIVGLFQYIPSLITGLCSGTASATASHYIFPLLTAVSKTLGC